jgi:periplasmic divalent cation tolerance protein
MQLVLTTEADAEAARRLARELLERRVLACVTMVPVSSMYHWEGEIEAADEVQLVFKTTTDRLAELRQAVAELHTYDVPEFIVLDAHASGAYQQWIEETLSERGTTTA